MKCSFALASLAALAACADATDSPASDEEAAAQSEAALAAGCRKAVHVWFEPTSGMEAITNDNGCWTSSDMTSGAAGWGWCAEINGTMTVKHAPANDTVWFFDDTNPVRTVSLDAAQIVDCYHAMPNRVAGVEVMARRFDPSTGTTHWQKIVENNAKGQWIVNHWIAELHSSAFDVASYFPAWQASPSIGIPQVNARDEGTTCDSRVYDAVLAVCRAIPNGGRMSIVKNDGRLQYTGGCLTHVTEALNACTRS